MCEKLQKFMALLCLNKRLVYFIWFLPVIIALIKRLIIGFDNNYFIFKYTFFHAIEQVNLYAQYPDKFFDSNHYGPVFSVIIAPFAIMPDAIGATLFCLFIAATLCIAINSLPIAWEFRMTIFLISAYSMFVSTLSCQTNPMVAALIIGTFVTIEKKNDFWAACFIMLGTFIKLYGIVGLAFFFFSKKKSYFITSLFFWAVIFFILPMILSSPAFVIQSYVDWWESLVAKNVENANSILQDISVMGMMRRITGDRELSNFIILVPALILFALQYTRMDLRDKLEYRLSILASTLMFVVLFSSGSESPTYIIALVGVAIWFSLQRRPYSKMAKGLLIFVFIFTCFATSDLMPPFLKSIIKMYALKSFPCLLVWLMLVWQIMRLQFISVIPESRVSKVTSRV